MEMGDEDLVRSIMCNHPKGVAIRKAPAYPGESIGEGLRSGQMSAYNETTNFEFEGHNITFYKLSDGRGWVHNYIPNDPSALNGVIETTFSRTGVGSQILVSGLDNDERWCVVKDVNILENLLQVHYLGFDPPDDEWIKEDSNRIVRREISTKRIAKGKSSTNKSTAKEDYTVTITGDPNADVRPVLGENLPTDANSWRKYINDRKEVYVNPYAPIQHEDPLARDFEKTVSRETIELDSKEWGCSFDFRAPTDRWILEKVLFGYEAHNKGLRKGDRIIAVNDHVLHKRNRELISKRLETAGKCTLTVERKGSFFFVNEKVSAQWNDGRIYPARIMSPTREGFRVNFFHFGEVVNLPLCRIKKDIDTTANWRRNRFIVPKSKSVKDKVEIDPLPPKKVMENNIWGHKQSADKWMGKMKDPGAG